MKKVIPVICVLLAGYAGICNGLAGDIRMSGMLINFLLALGWLDTKDQTIADQLAEIDAQTDLILGQECDIAFLERIIDKSRHGSDGCSVQNCAIIHLKGITGR